MAFRTQKISQMTPKGADLEATDLIEVSTIESGSYVTRSITGQELIDAIPLPPTGLTVGTTPISSGTNGRVLFQGTGNVLQQSSSLAYDDTAKLFSVSANQNATTNISVVNTDTTNASSRARVSVTSGTIIGSMTSIIGNDFYLGTESAHNVNFTTAGTTRFNLINSTGNLNIGTLASDIGARLGVRGSGSTSATKTLLVRNLANTDLLTIWDDGAIGVNTSTNAGFRLDVNGTARVQGKATFGVSSLIGTETAIFTTNSATNSFIRVYNSNTTIGSTSGIVFTNNTSGNSSSGIWGDSLDTLGNTNLRFQTSTAYTSTNRMIIHSTGNVGINTTTDAGFRLDVNGTARVVNALTLGNVVLSLSSQGGGTISCANSAGANTGSFINLSGPAFLNPTAGNSGMFAITGQYASSSGTANFNHLNLAPILNTTGTYSGIVRGLYYNPTLTSITGITAHYAWHSTSGRIRFQNLPTSATGLNSGELWNNLGVLMIV